LKSTASPTALSKCRHVPNGNHKQTKFLLAFHGNSVPILHRFGDIAKYSSKIADLNLPHLYLALQLGVTRQKSEFCCRRDFGITSGN